MYIPTICYVLIMYSYLRKQYTHSALKSGKEFNFRKISWKNHLHLHFFLNFWAIWRTLRNWEVFVPIKVLAKHFKSCKRIFFLIRKRTQWIDIQSCSKWKTKKKYLFVFFFIPKIWEMLKDFSRVFRRAQTLKFWRVDTQDQQYWLSQHSRGMIKNCTTICGPHNVIIPRNKNSNERKEKSVKKTYNSFKEKRKL